MALILLLRFSPKFQKEKNLWGFDTVWNTQSFLLEMRTLEVCPAKTQSWGATHAQDCVCPVLT